VDLRSETGGEGEGGEREERGRGDIRLRSKEEGQREGKRGEMVREGRGREGLR
jgi:hypothetical protein